MTALAANRARHERNPHAKRLLEPVGKASTQFYEGGLVSWEAASSTVQPSADTVTQRIAGVSVKKVLTTASGGERVKLEWGHSEWFPHTGLAAGQEGTDAAISDDNTLTDPFAATNDVLVGKIEEFETINGVAGAWVTVGVFATDVSSGEYTPTLTGVTNVAASALLAARFHRIGANVTVYFALTIDATTTGATELDISLPIASTLAAATDCIGMAVSATAAENQGAVTGDVSNDRAQLDLTAVGTGVIEWRGSFSYTIL